MNLFGLVNDDGHVFFGAEFGAVGLIGDGLLDGGLLGLVVKAGVGDRGTTGGKSDDESEGEKFVSKRFHNSSLFFESVKRVSVLR